MKRKLILAVILIAFLAGFGTFLQSPIDAISGATKRSRSADVSKLEGTYVFCLNTQVDGLDSSVCADIEELIRGDADTVDRDLHFTLYVSKDDPALINFATDACEKLAAAGANVTLTKYSDVMIRSRAISGDYEAFIAEESLVRVDELEAAAFFLMDSSEMG